MLPVLHSPPLPSIPIYVAQGGQMIHVICPFILSTIDSPARLPGHPCATPSGQTVTKARLRISTNRRGEVTRQKQIKCALEWNTPQLGIPPTRPGGLSLVHPSFSALFLCPDPMCRCIWVVSFGPSNRSVSFPRDAENFFFFLLPSFVLQLWFDSGCNSMAALRYGNGSTTGRPSDQLDCASGLRLSGLQCRGWAETLLLARFGARMRGKSWRRGPFCAGFCFNVAGHNRYSDAKTLNKNGYAGPKSASEVVLLDMANDVAGRRNG